MNNGGHFNNMPVSDNVDIDIDGLSGDELIEKVEKRAVELGLKSNKASDVRYAREVLLNKYRGSDKHRSAKIKFADMKNKDLKDAIFKLFSSSIFDDEKEREKIKEKIDAVMYQSDVGVHYEDVKKRLLKIIEDGMHLLDEEDSDKFRDYCVELLRRNMAEAYRFYVPNVVCEEYIKKFCTPGIYSVLFNARNGIGKSTLSVNMLANIMFESDNPYFDYPLFTDKDAWGNKPKVAAIISPSKKTMRGYLEKIEKYFPEGRYWYVKDEEKGDYYETDTGWKFVVITHLQYRASFEGHDFGVIIIDEPVDEIIWGSLISRTRMGCHVIALGTLVANNNKSYKHLYDIYKKNEGKKFVTRVEKGKEVTYPNMHLMQDGDTHSACMCDPANRGHMTHEHYLAMRSATPVDQLSRYDSDIDPFDDSSMRVLPNFNRDVHIIDRFKLDRKARGMCSYDIHFDSIRNDVLVWVVVDSNNNLYVVDELTAIDSNKYAENLSKDIENIERDYLMSLRIMDSYGKVTISQNPQGFNHQMALDERGIHFEFSGSKRGECDEAIRYCLDHRIVNGDLVQKPKLYVFSHCVKVIQAMEEYVYEIKGGKKVIKKSKPPKDKYNQDNTEDFMEALGRLCYERMKDQNLYTSLARMKVLNNFQTHSNIDVNNPRGFVPLDRGKYVTNKYSDIL